MTLWLVEPPSVIKALAVRDLSTVLIQDVAKLGQKIKEN